MGWMDEKGKVGIEKDLKEIGGLEKMELIQDFASIRSETIHGEGSSLAINTALRRIPTPIHLSYLLLPGLFSYPPSIWPSVPSTTPPSLRPPPFLAPKPHRLGSGPRSAPSPALQSPANSSRSGSGSRRAFSL